MITLDFSGQAAIVTGGTRGFGKAIAMALARTGATVFVTHRWGSVDERTLCAEFEGAGLPAPRIVECDASDVEATRELLHEVKRSVGTLRAIVSNVAFSKVVNDFSELKKASLDLSLNYSAWPVVELARLSREVFGRCPRYLIGISSDGSEVCHEGYDLAGVSKAVLETLCRYLAVRLKTEGTRVNVIRPHVLDTRNLQDTFGDTAVSKVREEQGRVFLNPNHVAQSVVALTSGLLDSLSGQVITIDEAWSLVSPMTFASKGSVRFDFPEGDR